MTPGVRVTLHVASRFLPSVYPELMFKENVFVNAPYLILKPLEDSQRLPDHVWSARANGQAKYFDYVLDSDPGVLNTLMWSFSGSKRCLLGGTQPTILHVMITNCRRL